MLYVGLGFPWIRFSLRALLIATTLIPDCANWK